MTHYLDNSSTTKPSESALKAASDAMLVWGNPSSIHTEGQDAARLLSDSRAKVMLSLGMNRFGRDKLIFTSTGTEANNLSMLGCAYSKKRKLSESGYYGHIIISDSEHPSIENPAKKLENEGYLVTRIPTKNGVLDMDFLKNTLENSSCPVIWSGFMLVNNETGAVYDVKSASKLIKSYYPDCVTHCDAVQGFMKTVHTPYTLGVDTMTVSAHKIHSLRGAGALFISADVIKRRNITPITPGGGQEENYRSGTENLVSIAAFAAAANEAKENLNSNIQAVKELREYLDSKLESLIESGIVVVNKPDGESIANIANISVLGVRSEVMLSHLSSLGVYVSAGSACSAHSKTQSRALTAFGLSKDRIDSAIRVSMSYTNTKEDIDALIDGIVSGAEKLKKKTR